MTRLWITVTMYAYNQKIGKSNNLIVLGRKGLNKIAINVYGHPCPREETLSFSNNYTIWEL